MKLTRRQLMIATPVAFGGFARPVNLLAHLENSSSLLAQSKSFGLRQQEEPESEEPKLQEHQLQAITRSYSITPQPINKWALDAGMGFGLIVHDSQENVEALWEETVVAQVAQLEVDNPDLAALGDQMIVFTSVDLEPQGLNVEQRLVLVQEGKFLYLWSKTLLGDATGSEWESFVDFVIAGSANITDDQETYTREELFAMIPGEDDLPEEWTFDPEDDQYVEAEDS